MIRPLRNQILIQVLPPDDTSNGVYIPEISRNGAPSEKKPPVKGVVSAIGPWKTTKRGFAILPEVKIGDVVIVSPYAGVKLSKYLDERKILIRSESILALLTSG